MKRLELATEKLNAASLIILASQSIQEVIRKEAAKYGLNPTEYGVLELLYQTGEQPIQAISKNVSISGSSITYVIDKLEQKEFVFRKACPADRRITFVSLTGQGKSLINQIFPQHEKRLDEIFCKFDEADLNKMIELLIKID